MSVEESETFSPAFGADGLIAAIVVDRRSRDVLMFAWMNADALRLTIDTGEAHFWSRSRKSLWRKGETSGERLRVVEILTDCDQDALLVRVEPEGRGAACHTGRRSCFYRVVGKDGRSLAFQDAARLFEPCAVYGAKQEP